MEEVKSIFNNTASIEIDTFTLITRPSGDFIPADLLGSSILTNFLDISGPLPTGMYPPITRIEIDPNAFRSSEKTLQFLEMMYFDTRRLRFDFLAGFQNISFLSVYHLSNLDKSIPTLPELPSLEHLNFYRVNGLKELFESGNVNSLMSNLSSLTAINSSLDGETVANLLDWILPSSRLTLRYVDFGRNEIEWISSQFSSFLRLDDINIPYNRVDMVIRNNSIFVPEARSGAHIDIFESRVAIVEPGAFQGKLSLSSNMRNEFNRYYKPF